MKSFLKVLCSPLISVAFGAFLCSLAAMYVIVSGLSSSLDRSQVIFGIMMGCGFSFLTSGICECLSRDSAGSPS